MITEHDLREAIAECQGERNPNSNTCIKLAAYYTILNNMGFENSYSRAEPPEQVRYNSGSEFSDIIIGRNTDKVLDVMDELMDTLSVLSPKLYRATLDKLKS